MLDGNGKPDMIKKITLDYHRAAKAGPKEASESAVREAFAWNYAEHLAIDREAETLEYIQESGTGCVSRQYRMEGGIEALFKNFDETLFSHIKGNPDDAIDEPDERNDYRIAIDYRERPRRVLEGSYDKNGLPEDFGYFAEVVLNFIRFYEMGEMFRPSVYGKVKRRRSDYIFCSVIFEDGYKSYYYLTDDDSIEIGDFVLVPAGKENYEKVVEVVDVEYFGEEEVPFPLEETKKIIRKCTEEDFGSPGGPWE